MIFCWIFCLYFTVLVSIVLLSAAVRRILNHTMILRFLCFVTAPVGLKLRKRLFYTLIAVTKIFFRKNVLTLLCFVTPRAVSKLQEAIISLMLFPKPAFEQGLVPQSDLLSISALSSLPSSVTVPQALSTDSLTLLTYLAILSVWRHLNYPFSLYQIKNRVKLFCTPAELLCDYRATITWRVSCILWKLGNYKDINAKVFLEHNIRVTSRYDWEYIKSEVD